MGFLFVVAAWIAVAAFQAVGQRDTNCSVQAFVNDPTQEISVRSGAGARFSVIKTLPTESTGTMIDVVGSRGEWLKIALAQDSKRVIFSGVGWISAGELAVKEKRRAYKVFEAMSLRSRRIEVSLFDHVLPLVGCNGGWVRVRLPGTGTAIGSASKIGWMPVGSYCGNPWIECDY